MGRGRWALTEPSVEPTVRTSREVPFPSLTEPAVADRIAVPVDVQQMSLPDLRRTSRAILRELVARNVLRTMNAPAGDLAEWLLARLLGGTLEPSRRRAGISLTSVMIYTWFMFS